MGAVCRAGRAGGTVDAGGGRACACASPAAPARELPTPDGDGSVDPVLDLVPARCDVHAPGESYRTGLIDLRIALGDADLWPFVLAPADDGRRRIESSAVDTCRARG